MAPVAEHRLDVITALRPATTDEDRSYFEAALTSFRSQAIPPGWQVTWLLHSDGPMTDDLREMLEASGLDVRIGTSLRSYGESTARNLALASGEGEFVTCFDDDDVLPPGALTQRIAGLSDRDWWASKALDLVDGVLIDSHPLVHVAGEMPPGRVRSWWGAYGYVPFHPATFTTRRSLVYAAGGWAALPREGDIALILRITDRHPGIVEDVATLHYRKYAAQTTRTVQRDAAMQRFVDASADTSAV